MNRHMSVAAARGWRRCFWFCLTLPCEPRSPRAKSPARLPIPVGQWFPVPHHTDSSLDQINSEACGPTPTESMTRPRWHRAVTTSRSAIPNLFGAIFSALPFFLHFDPSVVNYVGSAGAHLPRLLNYNTTSPEPGNINRRPPFPIFNARRQLQFGLT
jgi:hypothetical protein